MNLIELYKDTLCDSNAIFQILHDNYCSYIQDEVYRIVGYVNGDIIENVLKNVCVRFHEIAMDCDISCLIFDCLRKEILAECNKNPILRSTVKNQLLREYQIVTDGTWTDDLRLDIVLNFLPTKKRRYFLDRYYYLHNDIEINVRYEKVICRLFNGKGIASFRFKYFGIPHKRVTSDLYVDYLDRLDPSFLDQFSGGKSMLFAYRVINVPSWCTYGEDNYFRAKAFMPTSLAILLLTFLFMFIHLP